VGPKTCLDMVQKGKVSYETFIPMSREIRGIVGFEVLTAVAVKGSVFWGITPCSPLKASRRFGGTSYLHLQCRRISRAVKAGGKLSRLTFNGLHGVEGTWKIGGIAPRALNPLKPSG
jgi:hypothetical protein